VDFDGGKVAFPMSSFFQHGCCFFAVAALLAASAQGQEANQSPAPVAQPTKKSPKRLIKVETKIMVGSGPVLEILKGLPLDSSQLRGALLLGVQPTPEPQPSRTPEIPIPDTEAEITKQLTKGADGSMDLNRPMRYIGLLSHNQNEAVSRLLGQSKSNKLLGEGTLCMESGTEGKIEATRKNGMHNLGGVIHVKALIGADDETLELWVDCESAVMLGSLAKSGGKTELTPVSSNAAPAKNSAPVFIAMKSDKKTDVTLWDGQTAVFGSSVPELQAGGDGGGPLVARQGILIFISVNFVDEHGAKLPDAQAGFPVADKIAKNLPENLFFFFTRSL
jgi:hypothetical protein